MGVPRSLLAAAMLGVVALLLCAPVARAASAEHRRPPGRAEGPAPVLRAGRRRHRPATRRAVRRLQRRRGLTVDGRVGPRTRRALGRRGRPALGSRVMRRGQRGWDVAALQFLLRRRGCAPGTVDGGFGAGTARALRRCQSPLRPARRRPRRPVDAPRGLRRGRRRHPAGRPQPLAGRPRPLPAPARAPRSPTSSACAGAARTTGIDFVAAAGTPVGAAGRGVVRYAGWNSGGYGNLVVVDAPARLHVLVRAPAGHRGEPGPGRDRRHADRHGRRDRPHDRPAPALRGPAARRADRPDAAPARLDREDDLAEELAVGHRARSPRARRRAAASRRRPAARRGPAQKRASRSSSSRVPIVEPTTDSWRKNTRLSSAAADRRRSSRRRRRACRPAAATCSECAHVASPTVSITASTRSGSRAPGSNAASAPSSMRARALLLASGSSPRPARPPRAPSAIAAVATPPPAPWTSTVAPGATPRAVNSIR